MRCCLLKILFWWMAYRHTRNIAASFSFFEDNGKDTNGVDKSNINQASDLSRDNGVRQAIPPTPGTSNRPSPSATQENQDSTKVVQLPGYNNDDGKAATDDDDLMYYLTQYRARSRRTVEGHLCASAFVEKNQIYTDCTKEVAPDGTQEREWCYHESQLNGKLERDWGFCEPPLNYEKIRRTVIVKIQEKVEQAQEMKEILNKHRALLKNMEKRLYMYCGLGHKNMERSLTRLEEILNTADEDLKSMRTSSNEIQQLKEEIKRDECRYQKSKSLTPPEAVGNLSDGLVGTYYSGNVFEFPAYGSRVDREINFVFSDFMPIVGLDPHRFSVIWRGYIKAPHSGNFVFTIDTRSYVNMDLEGVSIINNGIVRQGNEDEGYRYYIDPMMRGAKLTSQSQKLIGGMFYHIQIEFSHSQQYHYVPSESVLKLEWSSLRLQREVIKDYLYTKMVPSSLAISYLAHDHFAINRAHNGVSAHMDDKTAFLANLSNNLVGSHLVTTLRSPKFKNFVMQVNVETDIYVGYTNDLFPISAVTEDALKFKDADGSTSYLVENGGATRMKLKHGTLMKGHIYKFNVEITETPFVMFLSQKAKADHSRGTGPMTVLSIPDSDFYQGCQESSKLSDGFGCESGLSGKLLDQKHAIWRADEGAGAWIKVMFKRPVLLFAFQLKQSDDPYLWIRRLSLEYDERSEVFEILHSSDPRSNMYYLSEPRALNSVLLRVDDLYTSSHSTALAVNFIGQRLVEDSGELMKIFMNCSDTLEDNVDVQPLKEGHAYELICSRKCFAQSSAKLHGDVMDIQTPPCSVLNIDLCRPGGNEKVCHAGLTVVRGLGGDRTLGYVVSRLNKHMHDMPFRVAILFRSAANRLPQQNFMVDNGSIKAPVDPSYLEQIGESARMGEVSYGWLRPNVTEDAKLGIAFPAAGESQRCIQKESCQPNFWSIDLPRNGKYKVELVLGDTSIPEQWISVELNGEVLLNCVQVPQGSLYTIVKEVDVQNNMLKVTSTSSNPSCESQRTSLQFFKVTEL